MFTAFYTLVRVEGSNVAAVTEPGHRGKVKTYTKPQFARSARSQADPAWCYRILETLAYADGDVWAGWVD